MGKGARRKIGILVAKAERGTAKRRELRELALRAGAAVEPPKKKGSRHDNVVDRGLIIGQIPRSDPVSRGVQKALVLALRLAGLIGLIAWLVWMIVRWVA